MISPESHGDPSSAWKQPEHGKLAFFAFSAAFETSAHVAEVASNSLALVPECWDLFTFKALFLLLSMHIRVCHCLCMPLVCGCLQGPDPVGTGVAGGGEQLDTGVGKQTQLLWKSSQHS